MSSFMIQIVVLLCISACGFSFPLNYSCTLKYTDEVNYGRDYSNSTDVRARISECIEQLGTQTNETEEEKSSSESSHSRHCQPHCIATEMVHKELDLLQSSVVLSSAGGCRESSDHCSSCQLRPSFHTYYPDQPTFTSTVDLGSCVGTCSNNTSNSCNPIRSTTIPIQGPNGYKTVSKTTKCGCTFSKCYRQEHFVEVHTESPQGSKLVDVGRCVGKCLGETVPVCVPKNICTFRYELPANICAPTSTVRDSGVDIIKSCGCGLIE